jgi:bifunctional non-homologous end joining protein LigD
VAPPTTVEVEGRRLSVSNLGKVLYPEAGFTKADVIDYYVRAAPALLTHLADRCVTFKRFPNGVDDKFFFEKRCPSHRPEWVPTAIGAGDGGQPWGSGRSRSGRSRPRPGEGERAGGDGGADSSGIPYCVINETAAVVWAANLAALELHTPMARATDIESPTMVVFDLDPGPPAAIRECADVALDIRGTLANLGFELFAKTSGNKGLQLYLPLNTPHTHDHAASFAQAVAQMLEKHHPDRVVSMMRKDIRKGKVFIDWSQNARFKTTVCAYSLRANPRPTVSTPVSWDEVADAADGAPLYFEAPDVLERLEDLGDLFAPTATLEQRLPETPG